MGGVGEDVGIAACRYCKIVNDPRVTPNWQVASSSFQRFRADRDGPRSVAVELFIRATDAALSRNSIRRSGTASSSASLAPASPRRADPMARWAWAGRSIRASKPEPRSRGAARRRSGERHARQKNRRTVIRVGPHARRRTPRRGCRSGYGLARSPSRRRDRRHEASWWRSRETRVVPSKSVRIRRLPAGARSWGRSNASRGDEIRVGTRWAISHLRSWIVAPNQRRAGSTGTRPSCPRVE